MARINPHRKYSRRVHVSTVDKPMQLLCTGSLNEDLVCIREKNRIHFYKTNISKKRDRQLALKTSNASEQAPGTENWKVEKKNTRNL